jgi:hypothetical protein
MWQLEKLDNNIFLQAMQQVQHKNSNFTQKHVNQRGPDR